MWKNVKVTSLKMANFLTIYIRISALNYLISLFLIYDISKRILHLKKLEVF